MDTFIQSTALSLHCIELTKVFRDTYEDVTQAGYSFSVVEYFSYNATPALRLPDRIDSNTLQRPVRNFPVRHGTAPVPPEDEEQDYQRVDGRAQQQGCIREPRLYEK